MSRRGRPIFFAAFLILFGGVLPPALAQEETAPVPPPETQPAAEPVPAPSPPAEAAKPSVFMEWHGSYWVRGKTMADANAEKDGGPGTVSLFEHRLLLKPKFSPAEHVTLNLEAFFFQFRPWGLDGGDVVTQSTEGRQIAGGSIGALQTVFGPRRGWAEVLFPKVGLIRVGRQPSDWGMGLVANDGDRERNDFGDDREGDTGDRIVFATKPLGPDGPLVTALGIGQVVEDDVLSGRDDVVEGLLAAFLDFPSSESRGGTYLVYRTQEESDTSLFIADVYGKKTFARFFIETELAGIFGESRLFNNPDDTEAKTVRQFGGALRAGGVAGTLVPIFETGLASGDGNLNLDDTISNFRFNPDYNVGLILFEELLPLITEEIFRTGIEKNVAEAPAAANFFPTEGRVTNAFYLYPRIKYRPWPALETKLAVVTAFALRDVLNPANLVTPPTGGTNTGLRGGDPAERYYGTEVDLGAEYTYVEQFRMGVEGGLAFPGGVFDIGDATGGTSKGPDPVAKGVLRLTWTF